MASLTRDAGYPRQDHIQGRADAPVTIVQYGDYECLYSGAAYPIIKDVQTRMSERLRFVFRNFPITSHPHAQQAVEAAEAATSRAGSGRCTISSSRTRDHLRYEDLRGYAEKLGLDVERFDKELGEHVHAARVNDDFLRRAERRERHPTFYINGVRHDDSYEIGPLLAAVERAAAPEHETG